jgi:multidrug efflux system membrane fusion protein
VNLHNRSLRHLGVFAALAGMLLLAGCAAEETAAAKGEGGKGKFGKGGRGGGGPVPVVVAPAVLKDVPIEIQVVGNVEASAVVSVRSQVSGQLTEVFFKDGDYVRKGDHLFTVDPRQIEGQLAQAEANLARSTAMLAQAQANLARDTAQERNARQIAERYAKLAESGIFSREQQQQAAANADALAQTVAADRAAITSAEAQIEADKAAINNIKLQRSYTSIYAPIDGRTGNIVQRPGNIITANNTELAVIHQVEPIYVSFAVPEARLAEVKRFFDSGARLPVIARAQDGSGGTEFGTLTFIDNAVDTSTGTIRLRGTFDNKNRTLWPGQFVNVTLQLTTRRNSVVVPNQAVQTGQDGTYVYVVNNDGTVAFRPVKVGPRVDLDLVIEEGLQAGEVVVTEGQLRLQPGARIQTRDASGGGRAGESNGGAAPAEGFKGKGRGPKSD